MTKEIVNKSLIASDVNLEIIKAFRIANKRIGEFKRENAVANYAAKCNELHTLAAKAKANGFKIWVNFNGKTGHTYSKDYKLTPDTDNDWETFNHAISFNLSFQNLALNNNNTPNN